jgi:acetylornithine deacetylase/succinyl-diaminopimelate desuccinylase-like protein
MAAAVAAYLREELGAEIVPEGWQCDPPLVHGRIDRGHPVTLLLYNMYDVMPATAEGWTVPPFTGGIVDLPGRGACFVGRGAENNKGPLAGMLVALRELLAGDRLRANVEILIEGQEETGSRTLRDYLGQPGRVRRCQAALFPSFCEYGGGRPRVFLGTKGIAHGVIACTDGPARPAHSSNISWLANPAWSLIAALGEVASGPNGFLGRVPLPADAAPVLAALAAEFDPQAELRFRHAPGFAVGGDNAEKLEAVLTTTSLNLSSIATDPPEGRATLPSAAQARFDLRLPPGVDPAATLAVLRERLRGTAADLRVEDVYPGHYFGASDPAALVLCETYRAHGVAPQVWPWALGAMPAYAFAGVADSFLLGGLGHGGNAHGPDEFVTLAGLDRFVAFLMDWLPATADALTARS